MTTTRSSLLRLMWRAARTRLVLTLSSPGRVAAAAALTGLLVWAAALRSWRLGAVGFGGDEAVYAGQAAVLAHVPGMDRWFIDASRGNSNFLATQWLVSLVYRVFGVSDWDTRLVSATASVLTVLWVYLIARELYGGRRYALGAGLVMAVSGYAVLLGRLALLDATACFFLTAAMYFLVRWMHDPRTGWVVLAAVAEVVAVQAKVTSALVVVAALILLGATGSWRRMTRGQLLAALGSALVAASPAILQVASNAGGLRGYFAASTARTSDVPWYYYLRVLGSAEGPLMFALLLLAVAVAVLRPERADLVPLVWLGVYAVFLEAYPLKGFNYLLPALPPLALLSGRLLGRAVSYAAQRFRWSAVGVLTAASAVLVLSQAGAVQAAVTNDQSAGMREAALWLRAQGAQHAGVIALSHGSGQYVLPFYGGVDAYPYGRFRIATVLPGGRVITSRTPPDGGVPLDWVAYWPRRLIAEGRVAYLVYQTDSLDDPPEQSQVAGSITDKQYRSFIAHFGGRLVHTVYWNHEARVYVYRVTRRLPRAAVGATPTGVVDAAGRPSGPSTRPAALFQRFDLQARGFSFHSPLAITYGARTVGKVVADGNGDARATVRVPLADDPRYHLIVTDQDGVSASTTAAAPVSLHYSVQRRRVHVRGTGFVPEGLVRLHLDRTVGAVRADAHGVVSWTVRLPAGSPPHPRISALGPGGRAAVAGALLTARLAFVARGATAEVTGSGFEPASRVTLTYDNRPLGVAHTDSRGRFAFALALPPWTRPAYHLVAIDPIGRTATVSGLVRR